MAKSKKDQAIRDMLLRSGKINPIAAPLSRELSHNKAIEERRAELQKRGGAGAKSEPH